MSVAVDCAEAVKDALADGTFDPPITPERSYVPEFRLRDDTDLAVYVVPRSVEITPATRIGMAYTVSIDVGIVGKITADQTADDLAELAQAIADYLTGLHYPDLAKWRATEIDPIYDPAHLKQDSLFVSIVRVTLECIVAVTA